MVSLLTANRRFLSLERVSSLHVPFPEIGESVSHDRALHLAKCLGLFYIAEILKKNCPPRKFKTDGCSCFPDCLYLPYKCNLFPACARHDLAYWMGGRTPENRNLRKEADIKLKIDIATTTGSVFLAHLMYWAVRIFSRHCWGWGWHES
jgi:hypothetical protein